MGDLEQIWWYRCSPFPGTEWTILVRFILEINYANNNEALVLDEISNVQGLMSPRDRFIKFFRDMGPINGRESR